MIQPAISKKEIKLEWEIFIYFVVIYLLCCLCLHGIPYHTHLLCCHTTYGCLSAFIFDLVWHTYNTKVWHISTIPIICYIHIHTLILSLYISIYIVCVYVFFDETYKLKLIIFLHLVLRRTGIQWSSKATLDTHNGTLLGMNGKKEMLHAEVSECVDSCMRKGTARGV